jgi:hypothetical protein
MPVLLTYAGTILLSTETGLVHAALATARPNLVISLQAQALHLRASGGSTWTFAVQREPGSNGIRLRGEGGFLHITTGGQTLRRDAAGDTSSLFLLLNDDQYENLCYAIGHRWAMNLPLAKSRAPAPGELLPGFTLRLCGCDIPLARSDIAFPRITQSSAQLPGEIIFQYGDFLVGRARLYNPLIYLCAFGGESIFEMAALFLESLATFGEYDGQIIILSDRPAPELARITPAALRPRTNVLQLAYKTTAEFATARYRVAAHVFSGFQPILYADIDIIAASPIAPMLTDLVHQDRICFACEYHETRNTHAVPERTLDWFGRPLFTADPDWSGRIKCINSGLIGFTHRVEAERVFPLVLAVIGQYQAHGTEKLRSYDQAYASYVVQKLGGSQPDFLNRYVRLLSHKAPDPKDRHYTLVHFNYGVGYAKKLEAMRIYFDALCVRGEAPAIPAGPI